MWFRCSNSCSCSCKFLVTQTIDLNTIFKVAHIVKLEIETTSITDRLSAGVASPQRGGAGLTVRTLSSCSLTDDLQKEKCHVAESLEITRLAFF